MARRGRRAKHTRSERTEARLMKQATHTPCDLAGLARRMGVPYVGDQT